MTLKDMLIGCLIMAGVTYITKAIGLLLFRKEIKNTFVQSFLYYIPYSVLAVMVFPAILFSTDIIWSGLIGTAVALILSFFKRGLLVVSLSSIAAVYLAELLFRILL
mgnify:CR=1 FL=1